MLMTKQCYDGGLVEHCLTTCRGAGGGLTARMYVSDKEGRSILSSDVCRTLARQTQRTRTAHYPVSHTIDKHAKNHPYDTSCDPSRGKQKAVRRRWELCELQPLIERKWHSDGSHRSGSFFKNNEFYIALNLSCSMNYTCIWIVGRTCFIRISTQFLNLRNMQIQYQHQHQC